MRRTYILAGLICLAIAIAAYQRVVNSHASVRSRPVDRTPDVQAIQASSTESQKANSISTRPAVSAQEAGSGGSSGDIAVSDPNALVGRAFTISPSVETQCTKRAQDNPEDKTCEIANEALSKMAQEARDPEWASATEAKLREELSNGAYNNPIIRSIECRQTMCAIEVASVGIIGFPGLLGEQMEKNGFSMEKGREPNMMGFETDSSGAKFTVDVWIYYRT
jgi:hypothetical protein